ncbi:MAG: nucleoside kinase, partial [Oscillospiraceae bacterium]|nr:nucleoside kinase [Oscillospiraceae bacterium]
GLRTEYYEEKRRIIATRDIRIVRRMIRDVRERGHAAEFTLSQWGELQRGEELWIKPFKKDADMLIDTSFEYEPCLLGALLQEIAADKRAGGSERETLLALCERFAGLPAIRPAQIPQNSTVREFIGGLVLQG